MVKRWNDRMAGVKYAPRPYEQAATVLERVEYFSHWFYTTHQKKGAVATKLGIGNKKLNRTLLLEQLPDEELLKGMMELCKQRNTHSTVALAIYEYDFRRTYDTSALIIYKELD